MEREMEELNIEELKLRPLMACRIATLDRSGGIVLMIEYGPELTGEGRSSVPQFLNLLFVDPGQAQQLARQLADAAAGGSKSPAPALN